MKKQQNITIQNGKLAGFADEVNLKGLSTRRIERSRVSRIVPVSFLLRIAFKAIRLVSSDYSKAAQWTRTWSCQWKVIIGKQQFGQFNCRKKAIMFEKDKIRELKVINQHIGSF